MKSPSIKVAVNKDQSYYWCKCGLSNNQPFCDYSHKGDKLGRKPVRYVSPQDKFISFCTCKATRHPPICDGSHNKVE